jgi:hypothetical protein
MSLKKIFIAVFFGLLVTTVSSCKTLDVPKGTQICIKLKIREIQLEKVRNPAASVWQYDYNGQTVYYIPPYCCDIPGQLFDVNCIQICSPDGGITGTGDGKCADFFSNRKNEKLIWQDDRK